MKISTKLLLSTFFCLSALTSKAELMNEARVLMPDPAVKYQTSLRSIMVTYDFRMITMPDPDKLIGLNMAGLDLYVLGDVYFDEEIGYELDQYQPSKEWGNTFVIDFNEEAYGAGLPEGLYTIEIPEGIVVDEDGNPNPAQTISFHKVNVTGPVSITPEEGLYKAGALKNVTLTFDGPLTLIMNQPIMVHPKNDWLSTPVYISDYKIGSDGKSLVVDLSSLPEGVLYSMEIEEGFVLVGENSVNQFMILDYMIWNGMGAAELVNAPAVESAPELNPFIITWDYQTLHFTGENPDTELVCGFPDYGFQEGWREFIPSSLYKLVFINENGEIIENPSDTDKPNAIFLDIRDYTDGNAGNRFEIFFPANLVANDEGLTNPPFSYAFNILDVWPQPVVEGKDGIIEIVWPGAENVSYNMEDEVTLTGDNGFFKELMFDFGDPEAGEISVSNSGFVGLRVNLNGLGLANGSYTLVVPTGTVVISGEFGEFLINGKVTCRFDWKDGNFSNFDNKVNMIREDGRTIIYNLNGMKVYDGTGSPSLSSGIYIINGKKHAVK